MLNLATTLIESAKKAPSKTVFKFGTQELNFQELNQQSNQVAASLVQSGLRPGEKVALTCPNILQFPIVYYGILKAGGVVVPLNVMLKPAEIKFHLEDSEAQFYFCFSGSAVLPMAQYGLEAFKNTPTCKYFIEITPNLDTEKSQFDDKLTLAQFIVEHPHHFDYIATGADDIAVILYTSGTTGQPKGAQLTHSNMYWNAKACTEVFEMTEEDIELIALPLFHSFGQSVLMNATILNGSTGILMAQFIPKTALEIIAKEGVTIFAGVPTMYWALLNAPNANAHTETIKRALRISLSGGAALPLQVLEDFKTKFDVPILEGYGLSETSPAACFNHLGKTNKPGSIGTPIAGIEIEIRDKDGQSLKTGAVGEVVIKGHCIMSGYLNKPETNKKVIKNGWFYTGDLGKKDAEGYFYIVDRTKDMIIHNGFNIYPREVEECLVKHPAVSMVAVVGIPSEKSGEEVKAYIQLQKGAVSSKKELQDYCKKLLANYKLPKHYTFVETFPMTATGKILKRELN